MRVSRHEPASSTLCLACSDAREFAKKRGRWRAGWREVLTRRGPARWGGQVLLAATVPSSIADDASPAALALKIGEGVQLFQKHAARALSLLSEVRGVAGGRE